MSNKSEPFYRWLVGTVIALLAAGSGIAALLNYFSPRQQNNHVSPPPTESDQHLESDQSLEVCDDPKISNEDKHRSGCPGF